ncbi:MAG: AI-2E family transporter [Oscillospiraceae bacterium]|jgi:sporulation integral membrane protein YtvI|nr:AI-2E family transporter [Oscillospiraceae bacterium]
MFRNASANRIIYALAWLFAGAVLILTGGAVLRAVLPFATAVLIIKTSVPLRAVFIRALKMPKKAAAPVAAAVTFLLLLALLILAADRIIFEFISLSGELPVISRKIAEIISTVDGKLEELLLVAAPELRSLLEAGISSAESSLVEKLQSLAPEIILFLSRTAASVPKAVLFVFVTGMGSVLTAGKSESVTAFVKKLMPKKAAFAAGHVFSDIKAAAVMWIAAQGKLAGVTFVISTVVFLILRVKFAVLLALLVAVADFLPIFGAGVIIVPWAAYRLLTGDTPAGVFLLLSLGLMLLVRNILEPRLVGKSLGLPPALALFAAYAGFIFGGVIGMTLLPIGLLIARIIYTRSFQIFEESAGKKAARGGAGK